jgi:hypothetical protein
VKRREFITLLSGAASAFTASPNGARRNALGTRDDKMNAMQSQQAVEI